MNDFFEAYEFLLIAISAFLMFVLAVAAIVAGIMAKMNLNAINKQIMATQHQNTLTTLFEAIYQMTEVRERNNRGMIARAWSYKHFDPNDKNAGKKYINDVITRVWQAYDSGTDPNPDDVAIKNAVEETVVCLDKVGFFLRNYNATALKNDIPSWVFSITVDMWNRLGGYIEYRHENKSIKGVPNKKPAEPNWGRYFEKLYETTQRNNILQRLSLER